MAFLDQAHGCGDSNANMKIRLALLEPNPLTRFYDL
jgi:hypothetical protein